MTAPAPIEVTTRYATTVDELTDAFAFVMARLDSVGPDPEVIISPLWITPLSEMDNEGSFSRRQFSVVVSGMVEEAKPGA